LARLPAVVPRWAPKPYGPDELAWDEARLQCRRALYSWAVAKTHKYYSDLVPLVTAIPWPEGPWIHQGQQTGHLLGQVSMAKLSRNEDRPVISALVASKEENMPSKGFWDLLDELGITVGKSWEARLDYWKTELERCFDTYGRKS